MSQAKILVIDDSTTIRRLVDSHLSQAGYQLTLAENAEIGLELASQILPDMILLDHQLPGTTGYQVCLKLQEDERLRTIPVVISSTLRKKAYAEYMDISSVVDMLPKPYTPDLLLTTVSNALDTGSLVVQSQVSGTAVPEVTEQVAETALSGDFQAFSPREIIDFLNNGAKTGALEIEAGRNRFWFFLNNGHIQGVTAPSISPELIAESLPDSLTDLAAILNFTVGGRGGSQVSGLVDLLDKKVLDPRLLRSLLRHQSSVLSAQCLANECDRFRFEANTLAPSLFRKLPLDVSLAAMLVDGVINSREFTPDPENTVYVRKAQKGQNVDKSGLLAQHMKLLGFLENPLSTHDLAEQMALDEQEVERVLRGFVMADWVQCQQKSNAKTLLVVEPDRVSADLLRDFFVTESAQFSGKVVRDRLGAQLILRRSKPDFVLISVDQSDHIEFALDLLAMREAGQVNARFLGICEDSITETRADVLNQLDGFVTRPYGTDDLMELLKSEEASQAAVALS